MLSPGTIVGGDFRVVRLLKEGGMGAVYVAEQVSLREMRALKVMRAEIPGLDDAPRAAKYRERFLDEARRSSGLRSAHVVKVVASGIDGATQLPWLAMELLQGRDLDGVLQQRGRLSWGETRTLFEQVAHGLATAHAAGVLHLDLKPENLFVAEPESPGVPFTVKILDFGIGRVVEEHRASVTATTAVGSPLWMSPEQALKQQVSAATDLWALGLIAYRCLTGRHYWREADKSAEEFTATGWILEVMTQAFEPASVRARQQGVEALLPRGFDEWFARCVTRERTQRWQSVRECIESFRRLDGGASDAVASMPTALPSPAATMALQAPPSTPSIASTAVIAVAPVPLQDGLAARSPGRPRRTMLAAMVAMVGGVAVAGVLLRRRAGNTQATTLPPAATPVVVTDASVARSDAAVATPGPEPALSCPEGMVLLRGGTLAAMGDAGTTAVAPFCLGVTEVTVEEYDECVRGAACPPRLRARYCSDDRRPPPRSPARCVTWMGGVEYCHEHGGRLPTDLEWEFAARGPDGRQYPWGDSVAGDLCTSGHTPCVVDGSSDDRSPEGVLGLAGNVTEWIDGRCALNDPENALDFRIDPNGPWRLTRGGDYVTRQSDDLLGRSCAAPAESGSMVGFRCAMDPIHTTDTGRDR